MNAAVIFEGKRTTFLVNDPHDHIQGFHARGTFYELHQLVIHRNLIPMNSTVLDVGANVGNHTIFYAAHTRATRVYPFEPNADARSLLTQTLRANPNPKIDESYCDIALGAKREKLLIGDHPEHNLGATSLIPSVDGDIDCVRLDDLKLDGAIGFMKIDVEGMEMQVLMGGTETIAKHRPAIAIEVNTARLAELSEWRRRYCYCIAGAIRDYIQVWNFVLVPG